MAKLRVFLSSTYYDLRHIRADLDRFIRDMGYDPVLNERGNVPYGSEERLEEYAYKEIEMSDILVSIVGGRYGSPSQHNPHSISQAELKKALELGKQVYIFVDRNVYSELATFKANKNISGIQYSHVDNVEIYKFLESLEALPTNNTIATFETSIDIINYLKEQWAGLFQRLLLERARLREVRMLDDLKSSVQTLNQLVTYITKEQKQADQAVRDILLSNHPAFAQFRKILNVTYRVFFTNRHELHEWLRARGFGSANINERENREEWIKDLKGNKAEVISYSLSIFDENDKLKVFTAEEWDNNNIRYEQVEFKPPPEEVEEEENLPF